MSAKARTLQQGGKWPAAIRVSMADSTAPRLGDRLSYGGHVCTVRYIGPVSGATGDWLGVEWDDPTRGKHDGSHKAVRYFTCLSTSPTAASFVRPTRPVDPPRTFLDALHDKYASEVTPDRQPISSGPQIVISGKVAEEVGFDKIRKQQSDLGELKIVILDGMRIASAAARDGHEKPIRDVCPKVTELDLSRNLFVRLGTVVDICAQLDHLRGLRLNGNRFAQVLQDASLRGAQGVFGHVKELAFDETLMQWDEICHAASECPSLTTLYASTNQLSRLAPIPRSTLSETLTSVYLEFNEFSSLADVASLTALTALRHLHLKGNSISTIASDTEEPPPVFSQAVVYLDISYNRIHKWTFVDAIPDSFPGLTSLRLAHNPVYENPGLDPNTPDTTRSSKAAATTEEAYMLTIGRLASLQSLNFSSITPNDRTNAEMFYLSRIGRQLSSTPDTPEAEAKVIAQHRRYAELCELYGEPVINRRKEVNPAFLEARLIDVLFRFAPSRGCVSDSGGSQESVVEKRTQIPKSVDIYGVKGIAGRLFGQAPLKLRLVWETGEWDPVAGFDDTEWDSSGEDEVVVEEEEGEAKMHEPEERQSTNRVGRWIKREVELKESPRHFGFCVDGLDVTIRVESK